MWKFYTSFIFFIFLSSSQSLTLTKRPCFQEVMGSNYTFTLPSSPHPWSRFSFVRESKNKNIRYIRANPDHDRGFFSLFSNVVSELHTSYVSNEMPVVIWDGSNYNTWEFDEGRKQWYQNETTGWGVPNLWTHLFHTSINYNKTDEPLIRLPIPPSQIEQYYSDDSTYTFVNDGLWSFARPKSVVKSRLTSFLENTDGFFKIGIQLRGGDRKGELDLLYDRLIITAKTLHQEISSLGFTKIVFLLVSDTWELLLKTKKNLESIGHVMFVPGVARVAQYDGESVMHRGKMGNGKRFQHPTTPEDFKFFQQCLQADTKEKLKEIFDPIDHKVSCYDRLPTSIRPSYKLAEDCLLETLALAHCHVYIAMTGNFGHGALMLNNDLPSFMFTTSEAPPPVDAVRPTNTIYIKPGVPLHFPCEFRLYFMQLRLTLSSTKRNLKQRERKQIPGKK